LEHLSYSAQASWLFTGFAFWVFFTVVVGLYSLLHKNVRVRNVYLLLVSIFFYYKTGGWFYTLLVFSCMSNYAWGMLIGNGSRKTIRLIALWAGVVMNLSLLAYFKYAFFFTDVLNSLVGDLFEPYNWLAAWWNSLTGTGIDTSEIILPIGISFFTFQAISYLVDVYKGRSAVVRNIFDFSFYLSFFPQLVAGPIVRASAFVPQLYKPYSLSKQEFGHALFLILCGLMKKLILSDFLAVNFIDRVFDAPGSFTGAENLMAVYGYALQIYGDFSGYTDMAIGVALLLGFRLPVNFNSPYKATSLTDFWRRWHISLSTWLRDYLYIPLGGNRKGKIRMYINLMVTMVLGGLWHGANIRFVIWGTLHGAVLVFEKALSKFRKRFFGRKILRPLMVLLTFHIVCVGWVFFRAETADHVWQMFNRMWYSFDIIVLWQLWVAYPLIFGVMAGGFILHGLPDKWQEFMRGKFIGFPLWGKSVIVLIVLFILHLFFKTDIQPFIYFRF
jgi:D-alanyl-lipoteichoic acid acyltransferase DltB (MBOAT superfamily)